MQQQSHFEGFRDFIQPLEQSDPQSFHMIRRLFGDITASQPNPFSLVIQRLTARTLPNREALVHWRRILEHKRGLELKVGRKVTIQIAAMDYFDQIEGTDSLIKPLNAPDTGITTRMKQEDWIERIYAPGYHLERLKDEMLRAKRYKHALSAILLDIDEFRKINETFSFEVGDRILMLIVKIMNKVIRNVDILSRYSGDQFLIILPSTNKREAVELAERLRNSVSQRTKRIEGLPNGVTLTLSVAQCSKEDTSASFMKKLESILGKGKMSTHNAVYSDPG